MSNTMMVGCDWGRTVFFTTWHSNRQRQQERVMARHAGEVKEVTHDNMNSARTTYLPAGDTHGATVLSEAAASLN